MRHLLRICLTCLLVFLCSPVLGASFPSISGPVVYTGELRQEKESYTVLLILNKDFNFLLNENFVLPNGKHSKWEEAGQWSQVSKGAFVELSAENSISRLINVGGAGNLYMNTQLPTGPLVTVILRRQTREPEKDELLRMTALLESRPIGTPQRIKEIIAAGRRQVSPVFADSAENNAGSPESPERAPWIESEVSIPGWKKAEMAILSWKHPDLYAQSAGSPPSPSQADADRTLQALPEQAKRVKPALLADASWKQTYMLSSLSTPKPNGKTPAKPRESYSVEPLLASAVPPAPAKTPELAESSWKQTYLLSSLPPARRSEKAAATAPEASRGELPLVALAPGKGAEHDLQHQAQGALEADAASADSLRKQNDMPASPVTPARNGKMPSEILEGYRHAGPLATVSLPRAVKSAANPVPYWKHAYVLSSLPAPKQRAKTSDKLLTRGYRHKYLLSTAAPMRPVTPAAAPMSHWKQAYVLSSARNDFGTVPALASIASTVLSERLDLSFLPWSQRALPRLQDGRRTYISSPGA